MSRSTARAKPLRVALVLAFLGAVGLLGSVPASAATGSLSGTVTEAGTGAQVAGVPVQAYCWAVPGSAQGALCGQTVTGSNGGYSLALDPGSYKVLFDAFPAHRSVFYGGGTSIGSTHSLPVPVTSGGTTTGIDAALEPLRTVTGTVTAGGGAAAGINVIAYQVTSAPASSWQSADSATTVAGGTYTLHLGDGTYRIGFVDPTGPFRTEYFNDSPTLTGARDVVVAGAPITGISADLIRSFAITGGVTVDGVNMPGVNVTAWQADTSSSTGWTAVKVTVTGPDGHYALYLPDGTYRVQFQTFQARFPTQFWPGVGFIDDAADIVLAGADVPDINATVVSGPTESGPAISGTVSVLGGGVPDLVNVVAWRWNPLTADWANVRETFTNPDGTYALFVPEGTYRVGFSSFGRYQPVFYGGALTIESATDVVVPTAGAFGIDATVVENKTISGEVTADPTPGAPPGPPLVFVSIRTWDPESVEWVHAINTGTGPDGRYQAFVPDGTYRVEFIDPSGRYEQPLFYGGADNIGSAADVVVDGADVTGIDGHLVLGRTDQPLRWPAATTLSAVGHDAWAPVLAVGPDATATAVWYRSDGSNTRVQTSTRLVTGTWSPPATLSAAGADAFDPQIATGAGGTTVAVWRQWDGANYRVVVRSRASADAAWSPPTMLSPAGQDAWDARASVGPKGAVAVVWRRSGGANERIQASSRLPNKPWSNPVTLSAEGGDAGDPQVAFGAGNSAFAVWSLAGTTTSRVQESTLSGNGAWSTPVTLSGPVADATTPQVAAGATGVAAVVWRSWDGTAERVQAASTDGTSWSAPLTISPAGRDAHDPDVAVDPSGLATAVWLACDGSEDRVQTAWRAPGAGGWSTPTTLSSGNHTARAPHVSAGAGGAATAIWSQSENVFGLTDSVRTAARMPNGSWSVPSMLALVRGGVSTAQLAIGPDGAVGAVWEKRFSSEDRIQGVVRFVAPVTGDCYNNFGVNLNFLFGVAEPIADFECTILPAKSAWRPFASWVVNTSFDAVPPGYLPAAATPLADLLTKLASIRVIVDPGTRKAMAFRFAPADVLRTDRMLDDFTGGGFPAFPMATTIPRVAALPAGEHRVLTVWTLSAEHCDGFTDDETFCLPSGDSLLGDQTITVVKP